MTNVTPSYNKFKMSRRGRKLQVSDDQRTLVALPKDVPERTWAEILLKEENDLVVFDIREEILENALELGYVKYMEQQTATFTVHCATEAWLKLIDCKLHTRHCQTYINNIGCSNLQKFNGHTRVVAILAGCKTQLVETKENNSGNAGHSLPNDKHFYRHDPGEDASAYPPCYIPKRAESWIPDELPDPSPKDTWGRQELTVVDDNVPDVALQRWPSSSSLDTPVVEEIPSEYWFPGKIKIKMPASTPTGKRGKRDGADSYEGRKRLKKRLVPTEKSGVWNYVQDSSSDTLLTSEENLNTESEVLQKITDYSTEGISEKESTFGELKTTTPVDGSLHGAGDSTVVRPRRRLTEVRKSFTKPGGRSKATLPPLDIYDSRSRVSIISDCRLRNLRLDTQYEITSEKVESPIGEILKRK